MATERQWRAAYGGVAVLHAWGNPMRITLESERPYWFGESKKQIDLNQHDALDLAERIFSAYGFGGEPFRTWRQRFPERYPQEPKGTA